MQLLQSSRITLLQDAVHLLPFRTSLLSIISMICMNHTVPYSMLGNEIKKRKRMLSQTGFPISGEDSPDLA